MATSDTYVEPTVEVINQNHSDKPCDVDSSNLTIYFDGNGRLGRRLHLPTFGNRSSLYTNLQSTTNSEDITSSKADLVGSPQPKYTKHFVMALLALAIAFPFGVIALLLAASARSKSRSTIDVERVEARKDAEISLGLSVVGIAVVIIAIVVAVSVTSSSKSNLALTDNNITVTDPDYIHKFFTTMKTTSTPSPLPPPCEGFLYESHCFQYMLEWNPLLNNVFTTSASPVSVETSTINSISSSVLAFNQSTVSISSSTGTTTIGVTSPTLRHWCRFGVLDKRNDSLCYYNYRYNVSGSLRCPEDLNPADQFCYRTVSKACELAFNYRVNTCYKFALPVGFDSQPNVCNHGYLVEGYCFYDHSYSSTDPTCNGFIADRGIGIYDDGYCYNSSTTVCSHASNYKDGVCYSYVVPVEGGKSCSPGHFRHPNCYYKVARRQPSDGCNPLIEDHHDMYCYHK